MWPVPLRPAREGVRLCLPPEGRYSSGSVPKTRRGIRPPARRGQGRGEDEKGALVEKAGAQRPVGHPCRQASGSA